MGKKIDSVIKALAYVIMVEVLVLIILVLSYLSRLDSYALEPTSIFEPIPFDEMIAHDEEVAFQKYVEESTEYYGFTEEEIDLLARMCMSEASILGTDAKHGIVHTALARFYSGKFGDSIEDILTKPYQYSLQDNGTPTEECYCIVRHAIKYFDSDFPSNMYYFRENHYHGFGDPYLKIGSTYFSTEGEPEWD